MSFFDFPRQSLGFFPTPLTELKQLTHALAGPELFIKRDDLTGLALGGNKTRKLEYILADALAKGADCIITAGAVQSNHCRQTAAAAAALQLECHLLLGGEAPASANGNLLLDQLFGAHIHWSGEHRKGEDIPRLVSQLKKSAKRPYVVPYGGSNELGAVAFMAALQELEAQITPACPAFSHIVFASSSGGTQAGLILANALLQRRYQIIGIQIDKDPVDQTTFAQTVLELANRTAQLIGAEVELDQRDVCLKTDYVGKGYGKVGPLEREAIALTARSEGILLDPVYTGRAMGGLIQMIRSGELTKRDRVLFWHTGGAPALFAYADELQQA